MSVVQVCLLSGKQNCCPYLTTVSVGRKTEGTAALENKHKTLEGRMAPKCKQKVDS